MSTEDKDALIEQVLSAWRPQSPDGSIKAHPAWHDLSAEAREEAFEQTVQVRALEAALDPDNLSSTARAVLEKIKSQSGS
ncbi:MAG: hypothetical protein AAFV53_06800 [Myxococcota bacterium]